jgi:hypothetical protein
MGIAPRCGANQYVRHIASHTLDTPKGIRTPVASVKGRCPRPLDDGGEAAGTLARRDGRYGLASPFVKNAANAGRRGRYSGKIGSRAALSAPHRHGEMEAGPLPRF